MPVLVMHVGRVRMFVLEPAMHMEMRMRLRRVFRTVRMLVVLVMHVRMCVRHRLVDMFMFVALGEVQADAKHHQQAGRYDLGSGWFAQ